jgi:GTP cyclohydrolase FolE2
MLQSLRQRNSMKKRSSVSETSQRETNSVSYSFKKSLMAITGCPCSAKMVRKGLMLRFRLLSIILGLSRVKR